MADSRTTNAIYVIAGVNGAGKSSVLSAILEEQGLEIFNPDVAAHRLIAENPGLELAAANSLAWSDGRDRLERAINEELDFALESTLGGQTITSLLQLALLRRQEVHISYVGLASVELHIKRVRSRAALGGHDIPENVIRQRYDSSRDNLIKLLPLLTELRLLDNSAEADPETDAVPTPLEILRAVNGAIVACIAPDRVPEWAKPIVAAAVRASQA